MRMSPCRAAVPLSRVTSILGVSRCSLRVSFPQKRKKKEEEDRKREFMYVLPLFLTTFNKQIF